MSLKPQYFTEAMSEYSSKVLAYWGLTSKQYLRSYQDEY